MNSLITKQDLDWTMVTKTINFSYTGGRYTQNFSIRGTNLPWRYECGCDWILVSAGATSLTVEVGAIYGFSGRTGTVRVFDKFGNEIDLVVEQSGYTDLSVEMPSDIVLYQDYYTENETYDVYVTVYGGPTQEVECAPLEPYAEKVWDNSDMYNDFVLRIPSTLKGEFDVKHSDASAFSDFCAEHGLDYPKEKLEKKLNIVQIAPEDVVGTMVVEYGGKEYTNNGEVVEVEVSSANPVTVKIISTEFVTVLSKTEYSVVRNSPVEVQSKPNWLEVSVKDGEISLVCNERNRFSDRYSSIMLVNSQNKRQNITVRLKQKSGD